MDWITAVLLGAVQGLTEFLPVSSSGHLVIGQKFLGVEVHDILFDVVVHVGTLLAVLVVYKNIILDITKDIFRGISAKEMTNGLRVLLYMFIASIPTALIGLSFKDKFEALFHNINAVAYFLAFTGFVLLLQKFLRKNQKEDSMEKIKLDSSLLEGFHWKLAVLVGLAQSFAIAPGVSRSGMTISMALILGLSGSQAALFSFLIAIPAILGASLLQLKDASFSLVDWNTMGLGFLSAFVFGYFGLKAVLKLVKKQRLEVFCLYLWILSLSLLFL